MKTKAMIITKLHQLFDEQNLPRKEILTFEEASRYLGLSKSNLYKKTSLNQIPFYKPNGKMIYFKRADLDQYMLGNRQATLDEITEKASNFKLNHKSKV